MKSVTECHRGRTCRIKLATSLNATAVRGGLALCIVLDVAPLGEKTDPDAVHTVRVTIHSASTICELFVAAQGVMQQATFTAYGSGMSHAAW